MLKLLQYSVYNVDNKPVKVQAQLVCKYTSDIVQEERSVRWTQVNITHASPAFDVLSEMLSHF